MEEDEFQDKLKDMNNLKCRHSKVIFSRNGECTHAKKFLIAEREGINCESAAGEKLCAAWVKHLKSNCLFALNITDTEAELPHGKAIKLQTGGLIGLTKNLNPGSTTALPIPNIFTLLEQSIKHFGRIEDIPLENIITSISAFQARKRSKKRQ